METKTKVPSEFVARIAKEMGKEDHADILISKLNELKSETELSTLEMIEFATTYANMFWR